MTSAFRTALVLITSVLLAGAGYLIFSTVTGTGATADDGGGRHLSRDLEQALEKADRAAGKDGVDIVVTSGLRSWDHQEKLWEQAVDKYGSEQEAKRWVLPPEESAHVNGDAVDVGAAGADWLEDHGAAYGLCRRYANEWWHFELLTEPGGRCPALVPDAAG